MEGRWQRAELFPYGSHDRFQELQQTGLTWKTFFLIAHLQKYGKVTRVKKKFIKYGNKLIKHGNKILELNFVATSYYSLLICTLKNEEDSSFSVLRSW